MRGRTTSVASTPTRPPESDVEEQAVWAGEAMSLVTAVEPAGAVVARLVEEATRVLTARPGVVLRAGRSVTARVAVA